MKKKKLGILATLGLSASLILSACNAGGGGEDEKEYKFLSIVTGGTTGTYYTLGGTLAQIISDEVGVDTTAEVSQASAANMTALKDGKAEIAFVQTDIAYYATAGELMFEGEAIDVLGPGVHREPLGGYPSLGALDCRLFGQFCI